MLPDYWQHETDCRENTQKWVDDYCFIFVADPQPGFVHKVEGGDGSEWDAEISNVAAIVKAVNKMKPAPKFLLIGGDIVDAMPGTEHRPKQVDDLRTAFSELNPSIPILVISGNHDVGQKPNVETMLQYRSDFGDDFYSFWLAGVFYIVLNSQDFFVSYETPFAKEQTLWLEKQLKIAKDSQCKHVVIFMHIPPFCKSANEEDSIFAIPNSQRIVLLEQFANANVSTVFSGHYHRNGGGVWTKENEDGSTSQVEVVVTTSIGAQLGDDLPGIRIVKVLKDKICHHFYPIEEIPETVQFD